MKDGMTPDPLLLRAKPTATNKSYSFKVLAKAQLLTGKGSGRGRWGVSKEDHLLGKLTKGKEKLAPENLEKEQIQKEEIKENLPSL